MLEVTLKLSDAFKPRLCEIQDAITLEHINLIRDSERNMLDKRDQIKQALADHESLLGKVIGGTESIIDPLKVEKAI
jgi:hypothetical protein